MVAHSGRRGRLVAACVLTAAAAVLTLSAACDKVPLLAPTGTVISLFPAANMVPINGEIEIVATVIENGTASAPTTTTPGGGTTTPGTGTTTPTTPTTTTRAGSGTPVQNGTLVSFTTTLGTIQPREARTNNGEVRVKFIAGGSSGLATITAYSGGASGKIENLKVGAAAVERVTLTASPQTLGPNGGASVISAHVQDVSGLGVSGIPVDFTSDKGQLSASTALTDTSGLASVTLTTSQTTTKVTANVAGKTADVTVNLNPRTGITIAADQPTVNALTPATFTVTVAAGSTGANVQNVTVDFGDGRRQSLGAISASTKISHTYSQEGNYTVTATATDASGFTESVVTSQVVFPAQPPSIIVTASPASPRVNETAVVTARVSGNTSAITGYDWNFDTGAVPRTAHTTGNQVTVTWTTTGTKNILVTATQATGPVGDGVGTVVVTGTTIR